MDNLGARAYEILKRKLIAAEILPGSLLSVNELSDELGMSRTPIHNAIARLEQEGYLQSIKKRGVWVRNVSMLDLYNVMEVLLQLTALVVQTTDGYCQRVDRERLEAQLQAAAAAAHADEYHAYCMAMVSAFITLFQASRNPLLHHYVQELTERWLRMAMLARKLHPMLATYQLLGPMEDGLAMIREEDQLGMTRGLLDYLGELRKQFQYWQPLAGC